MRECFPVLKKLLLQWFSRLQASKNLILNFPGATTHRLSTHKPPICFHWCILMLYAVFDTFHALVNPIRQDILRRGGAENRRFCVFVTLEFEFLTTYEVSGPLHRCKPFIGTFYIFLRFQGTISTSTGSSNLPTNFNSVFFCRWYIELLHINTRSYVVCSSPNIYAKFIIV